MGELMAYKRTGSVSDYQDRFEALLPRVGALEEEQRIQAFMGGLRPPLSHDVEMQNPQTLISGAQVGDPRAERLGGRRG